MASAVFYDTGLYRVFRGVQNVQVIDYGNTKNMSLTCNYFSSSTLFSNTLCFSPEPAFALIKEGEVDMQ
jgi:hypothetical protein